MSLSPRELTDLLSLKVGLIVSPLLLFQEGSGSGCLDITTSLFVLLWFVSLDNFYFRNFKVIRNIEPFIQR